MHELCHNKKLISDADIQYSFGQYKAAISLYQKALDTNPHSFKSIYFIGMCHYKLDQLDQAIECWNQAFELENSFK